MALYGLVPSNIEKFESVGFVHVPDANNVDVMYAKNFGITVVAVAVNIIAMLK
jgi:hypothetical protein